MTNVLSKVFASAAREYKATALTWAFFLGAIVFPAVVWGAIIAFSAFAGVIAGQRDPIEGTIAVLDTTENDAALAGVRLVFDPKAQAERRLAQIEQVRAFLEANPQLAEMAGGDVDQAVAMAERAIAMAPVTKVEVEALAHDTDLDDVRRQVREGERLALVVVDELSLALTADRLTEGIDDAGEGDAGEGDAGTAADAPGSDDAENERRAAGEYEVYHSVDLDPEYLDQIRGSVHRAIQDERYRRFGIEPEKVLAVADNAPRAVTRLITEGGEETESASGLQKALPFAFLFLMFGAVFTGGNYLLMGTIEEKQSRVMEVLLSAVSPWQLLIGKMIGQAAVGLSVMAIYGSVGLFAANRFGVLGILPSDPLVVTAILLYFAIAYLFIGAMMTAVGAAVTEIREAQALNAPILITSITPFLLLIVIMENPSSIIAKIASYIPPITPFVMVMRLSNPAYPVPLWEIALTILVGFAGVIAMVVIAARIFRVGVLSYGKPPSLLGLLNWARHG